MEAESLSSGQKGSFTKLRNQFKHDFNELIKDIEAKKEEIEEMRVLMLVDDDEGSSLQTQVIQARDEANTKLETISELLEQVEEKYQLLTNPSDGYFPDIQSTHEEISEIYETCSELMKKFKDSSKLLYGNDEDGLEGKMKELAATYELSLNANRAKAEELLLQIEGTLTGATNVELAKAFQDQKNSYKYPKYGWALLFIATLCFMIYLGFDASKISSEGATYLYDMGKRLMIFGPLIWLALFSSKQQAQNKRLEEEYAHKEAVTKTYVGHQRQIEKLGESDARDELLVQLAKTTIDTIDFNPSSTLEKTSHKKDLPASEVLEIAKQALDKVGK
ncbi:conserved hypothetical protein [Vibrio chagasii]|nr:conserved hypothetical protein [Vibrio chagasii]CAH7202878.1 conserved hypothetical protein [Vibrio chagasii]CAH7204200.1 conserved hypothetical protein [Vibrio chagasii]